MHDAWPRSAGSISTVAPKMKVKFTEKWGSKSMKVEFEGAYKNNRPPHVETTDPENTLIGKVFELNNRRQRNVGDQVAVMYDVQGVKNGKHNAHFTVYFGPADDASNY